MIRSHRTPRRTSQDLPLLEIVVPSGSRWIHPNLPQILRISRRLFLGPQEDQNYLPGSQVPREGRRGRRKDLNDYMCTRMRSTLY